MNREIKFRGWDAEIKRMLSAQDLTQNREFWTWIGLADVPLMQSTGLKDKNGKEIWEGDILGDRHKNRLQVIYNDGQWWGRNEKDHLKRSLSAFTIDERKGNGYEVLGNIYENPELLK